MGPIELTDLHRSKLLEMSRSLFPEYEIEFIGNFSEWGVLRINRIEDHEIFEKIHHWFEFCMTYLADKIFEDHDNFSNIKDGFITIFSIKDEHPIDYLYDQFKQLKQQ